MTNQPDKSLMPAPSPMAIAGMIANEIAGAGAFTDYKSRKAANTLRRQANELALFADYLRSLTLTPGDLEHDPEAWRGMRWGIVAGFARWLLANDYAVSSVNIALSTVKSYCKLAAKAGVLDPQELGLIKTVSGYTRKEAKHLDENRDVTRRETRSNGTKAYKKAEPVSLTPEQAAAMIDQPDTPQGRRDRFIMALFIFHGLRVGEMELLTVDNFDLQGGVMTFYRPKVDKWQTHKLEPEALQAAREYLAKDAPALGIIWRGSHKGGKLVTHGMSARAITGRVRRSGKAVGITGLSAHDLRHHWATQAARHETPLDRLQDAGGWSSLAMPARYIEAARIANEGVRLA